MTFLIADCRLKNLKSKISNLKSGYHFSLLKNEFQKPKKLKESP